MFRFITAKLSLVCFRQIAIIFMLGACSVFALSCQTTAKKKIARAETDSAKPNYEESLPPFPPDTIDGILAKVGNESILLSDLLQAKSFYPDLKNEDILNALVDEKIIEIKAHDLGVGVSEEELTRNIEEFLKSQNVTMEVLATELERNNKDMEEYREEFKKQIIKQQLIGRVISPFVSVTNDEVNRFYLQQTKNVKQVEKVKLRSLLLEVPDDYTGDVLKYESVQKIRNEIEAKANFVDLVRNYSRAQDAAQNLGVLPPKSLAELPEELQKKLGDLQIDQVVGPIAFGHSVFFFQYLGADFTADSDLTTHFGEWKNKLMNIKFNEHLAEYLRKERSSLKIVLRPYNPQSVS